VNITFPRPYLVEGTLELSPEEYLSPYKESLRELRQTLKIPGFRPGHTPADYVRSRYGKDLLSDILTKQFLAKLESHLGDRKLIPVPYIQQEPKEVSPHPPYQAYSFTFQALVRAPEPLRVYGAAPPIYKYASDFADLSLFRRYLQIVFGSAEPLERLPERLPEEKALYIKLQLALPGQAPNIRLTWLSLLDPFPYNYLAGKSVGDTLTLPPSHLMPYVEHVRAVAPSFSPLELESVDLKVVSAAVFTPASEEKVLDALQLSEATDEAWKAILDNEVQRLLAKLNRQTFLNGFLHAAGIQVPDAIVQLNYLLYMQSRNQEDAHLISYGDYSLVLGWRAFMESHVEHVPEIQISDEEVEENIWQVLKDSSQLTDKDKLLLDQVAENEEQRRTLVRGLIGERGEEFRHSLRYERFEKWVEATYGPRPEKALPLSVILLGGI
jgi:hypothetical protein